MVEKVKFKATLNLLDPDQVKRIHRASLEILSGTGVAMELSPLRYEALEEFGARVDREKKRVYFSSTMVEKALETSPGTYTLCARNPENNLVLDGNHGYLCLDGTGVNIQDLETGIIRPSTFQDLSEAVRVADASPQIAFLWPCLSAQEILKTHKPDPLDHEPELMEIILAFESN